MATRPSKPLAALLVAGCLLAACSADDTSGSTSSTSEGDISAGACATAVTSIVDATQRYVSGYESARAASSEGAPDAGAAAIPTESTPTTATSADALGEAEFQRQLDDADERLRDLRCDPRQVRTALVDGLGRVAAEGPVADAVLRQLSASLTGQTSPRADVVQVAPGEDLRDVVARVPEGTTIELAAGEHRLDASLVLLSGVTIRGAGRDATSIVSTAPDAAMLLLTGGRVELTGLTVRHEGDATASVVLGGPAASVVLTDARVSGGRVDGEGQGGSGILMFDDAEAATGRGTTMEVTGTELLDNRGGGIVLTGGHRASVVATLFAANGQCGICFLGAADGSVEDSILDDNGIGIAAMGTARPTLLRLTLRAGEVGIQAGDAATPSVEGVTITGAQRAALIFTGTAGGSLSGVTCEDVPFGIVISPDAAPQIGDTDCEVASSQ